MEKTNFEASSVEDMAMAQVIEQMESTDDITALEALKIDEESGSKTSIRIDAAIERIRQKKDAGQ